MEYGFRSLCKNWPQIKALNSKFAAEKMNSNLEMSKCTLCCLTCNSNHIPFKSVRLRSKFLENVFLTDKYFCYKQRQTTTCTRQRKKQSLLSKYDSSCLPRFVALKIIRREKNNTEAQSKKICSSDFVVICIMICKWSESYYAKYSIFPVSSLIFWLLSYLARP